MERTKLKDRVLPDYTKTEDVMNMVTHIVGGAFGIVALVLCTIKAASRGDAADIVGSVIYGLSLILLYVMSSVYHGLRKGTAKKVMQILDHCTIYYLIVGTYTPILLSSIMRVNFWVGLAVFIVEWACAVTATVFTAIDLKKYKVFSMICYILMGWCVIFIINTALQALELKAFLWLLAGGISYTVGTIFFGLGRKIRYMHMIFHLFVLAGSILQFITVYFYVL